MAGLEVGEVAAQPVTAPLTKRQHPRPPGCFPGGSVGEPIATAAPHAPVAVRGPGSGPWPARFRSTRGVDVFAKVNRGQAR
jgi:hypothetical protein